AFEIRRKLADDDHTDDVLQSNLATSHREIARLYVRRDGPGDLEAALDEYRTAIGIRDNLHTKDPTNATWQTSLAPLYAEAAVLLRRKGDTATALDFYRKEYALRRELALRDPGIAARQRGFANAGMSVADVLVARTEDLDEAIKLYRAAIETL